MAGWWIDDPSNPGRRSSKHPAVRQIITAVDPTARITDLGGTMSLNIRLTA
jgi:hypothetical protein